MKSFEFCYLNSYEILLYSSDTLGLKTIKPHAYYNFAACIFMDKLYATGGEDEYGNETKNCAAYDPRTNEWTTLEGLQTARCLHSCVVFAGKIVVTGGLFFNKTVEAYDHFENKWSYMPDLIEGRERHGSLAIEDKLYVIGGAYAQSCEVFNYISNKFTLFKPMLGEYNDLNVYKYSFFRIKDKIIVKYETEDKEEDNVYIYDTKEDRWISTSVDYFKENSGQLMYS